MPKHIRYYIRKKGAVKTMGRDTWLKWDGKRYRKAEALAHLEQLRALERGTFNLIKETTIVETIYK